MCRDVARPDDILATYKGFRMTLPCSGMLLQFFKDILKLTVKSGI